MSHNIAVTLIISLCVLGPSIVFIASSFASIQALGRNPSASPKIFTAMIIALAFTEALAFVALLVAFQLLSKGTP
ncbi:MAG: ATP synthase F0 subunit C [Candidatus Ratteibacteria bacterium]|nr:ATP synthase F0 subunit C [Candidatus Ratteibacteria bacterium]